MDSQLRFDARAAQFGKLVKAFNLDDLLQNVHHNNFVSKGSKSIVILELLNAW